MFKRYGMLLFFTYSLVFCAIWFPLLLLIKSSETSSYDKLISSQLKNNSVWGAFIENDEYKYKLKLLETIKPEIVTVGSSRVLQFRQSMFDKKFVNFGRGWEYCDPLGLAELLVSKKVKYVIWGLDHWHYKNNACTGYFKNKSLSAAINTSSENKIISPKVFSVWSKIFNNKIPFIKALSYVALPSNNNELLGLKAIFSNTGGTAPDGSYYYFNNYINEDLMRKKRNKSLFEMKSVYGGEAENVSSYMFNQFEMAIELLKKNNINVVYLLMPLPEEHIAIFDSSTKFSYLKKTRKLLTTIMEKHDALYYDLLEPKTIGSSTKDFLDTIHPSDACIAKVMTFLVEHVQFIHNIANTSYIQKILHKSSKEGLYCDNFLSKHNVCKQVEP